MRNVMLIFSTWFCAGATLEFIQRGKVLPALLCELIAIIVFLLCRRLKYNRYYYNIIYINDIIQFLVLWVFSQRIYIHTQFNDWSVLKYVINTVIGGIIYALL